MPPISNRSLPPLPAHPRGLAWPTHDWPEAEPTEVGGDSARLGELLDELVDGERHPTLGLTHAAAVVAGGRLVAERYGRRVVPDLRSREPDPPLEDVTASSELLSWSMAKSITHLAVGVAVADGCVDIHEPVPDPGWSEPGDERAAITWDHLLAMRPGLAWTEEYYGLVDGALPDVLTMLFGTKSRDMAAYAASFPLVRSPGSDDAYNYSSGTTNIVAANLQRALDLDGPAMKSFLHERIFTPVGMTSARAQFDAAGTFIGSSYVYATLRDWCRFALLAIRGGTWDGRALVPPGWIDHGRTARSWDEDMFHGAHWWTWDLEEMPFGAHGFEGQRVVAFPRRDVVVVRLGQTHADQPSNLNAHLLQIAECFPVLP